MSSVDDYLAKVGVPSPGGSPAAIQSDAQTWHAVSGQLGAQVDSLTALIGSTEQGWHGTTTDAFARRASSTVQSLALLQQSTKQLADAQDQHADNHAKVLAILREIAIQIMVTLALMALSSLLPQLLAMLEARLALLAVQAGRAVTALEQSLNAFLETIAEIRSALQSMMSWSITTERVTIPAGRALVEGARDFAVDIATNATTSKIEGKSISPGQLFISAGISGAVGALLPAIGRMGVWQDESEVFTSADDLYRRMIRRGPIETGRVAPLSTRQVSLMGEQATDSASAYLDRFTLAQAAATSQGLNGTSLEIDALASELKTGELEHAAAEKAAQQASKIVQDAEPELTRLIEDARELAMKRSKDLDDAYARYWADARVSQAAMVTGDAREIDQAATRLAESRAQLADTQLAYDRAGELRRQSLELPNQAAALVSQRGTELKAARQDLDQIKLRHQASVELHEARADVLDRTTTSDQLAYFFKHNQWRDGEATDFHTVVKDGNSELVPSGWRRGTILNQPISGVSNPKALREILFYDGVKDGFKGALSSTAYTGYKVSQGQARPSDIGVAAALGAAGGSVRGMAKGAGQGRLFPAEGGEEIIWRAGTKGLDKIVRDEIKDQIDPPGSAKAKSEQTSSGGGSSAGAP